MLTMQKLKPLFVALALPLLGGVATAQGLDIIPSYHPDGPTADFTEIYMDDALVVQFSLPGLDHTASLAVAPTHVTFLAVGLGALPFSIPLGPELDLWLDPVGLILIPIGPTLELPITISSDPLLADGILSTQVVDIDILDPLLTIYGSGLIQTRLMMPETIYADEMLPLGVDEAGTDAVTFDAGANAYKLTHTDSGGVITEYIIDLNAPSIQNGSIQVSETTSSTIPAIFGGVSYQQGTVSYDASAFEALGTHTLLGHSSSGDTVSIDYQDDLPALSGGGTTTHTRTVEYTLRGKSLRVHMFQTDSDHNGDDNYSGFFLGTQAALNPALTFTQVRVPYMDQIGISLLSNGLFFSSFIDVFQSNAQSHNEATFFAVASAAQNSERMIYTPGTDNLYKNLDETGWITVSDDVSDCFVRTTFPKGPHADDFADHVAVAYSKETINNQVYQTDLLNVQRMQNWGMDKVLMWKTHWMWGGQNRRATTHYPADPVGGTNAELSAAINTAVNGGWRTAMYTDYYSIDQAEGVDDNPAYSELAPLYINWDDSVRDFSGNYRKGYGTAVDPSVPHGPLYHSRLLAPNRSLKHFKRETAVIMPDYNINANYFDVMTISAPDLIVTGNGANQGVISGDHTSPNVDTLGSAINSYRNLFIGASDMVNGPSLGEGSFFLFERRFDTFYMGFLDGAWRTLSTGGEASVPGQSGEEQPIIPDYEVNVVRPVMPGLFGMGQYTRFYKPQTHPIPYQDFSAYEYRATEISYGHNGFLMTLSIPANGGDYHTFAGQIKEYYAMQSFPDEWDASTGAQVEYRDGLAPGAWMDLSTAMTTGLNLAAPVVRLTYTNGLTVVVNHSGANVSEGGYTLPHNGWTALNPSTGYTNLSVIDAVSGARIDHVIAPGYEMADANGTPHNFGGSIGLVTNLKVVVTSPAKTLIEQPSGAITVL
jgi:hypothetical protein